MTATVAIPAAMKVAVATSERCDNRLTPHTPWPLVQPLPIRAPMPTRRPHARWQLQHTAERIH